MGGKNEIKENKQLMIESIVLHVSAHDIFTS